MLEVDNVRAHHSVHLDMLKTLLSTLVVLTLAAIYAQALEGPDTGGLDTEPGLRLRIYSIGQAFDPDLPLQPGQSANVDLTVHEVAVEANAIFQDKQELTAENDEKINNHYVAEWSGWVKAAKKGKYTIHIDTNAQTILSVADITETTQADQNSGNMTTTMELQLEAAWHPIRLVQKVDEEKNQPIRLSWKQPGTSKNEPSTALDSKSLLAPKFYFRPTQVGKKLLVESGSRPGLGKKLTRVHPGYRITNIRPGGMEMPVGGLGMLPDGRLAVARFDAQVLRAAKPTEAPNGELWLISNPTSDDPSKIKGEKIAEGLFEPSGLKVLGEDIYVSQRHEISKFSFSKQNKKWNKKAVSKGWETNDFHQISAGLPWQPGPTKNHPGFFYMSRGAGLGRGQNPPDHGAVYRIDLSKPADGNYEVLSGGHRTPNGLGLNTAGECFVIDNQGGWTPSNEINHIQKGKFYGFYQHHNPPKAYGSPFQPNEQHGVKGVTPPAIHLPQNEIGNSPTELLLFPKGHRFEGQMAMGDMRYGGLNRVFLEEVDGVWQGCAMRFTQGLEAGPNRIFFGPDGSLYVGGIGGRHAGTWFWVNPKTLKPTYGGLERLTPSGEEVFEVDHMKATKDGFILTFTKPVAKEWLEHPEHYQMVQWTYLPTGRYGGPKVNENDLEATKAVASSDGLSVALSVPNIKEGYCIQLTTNPVSRTGEAIWSGDVWYTLNRRPI